MGDLDRIYNILVGEKVFDGDAWHIYDKWGVELSDPGGVMWRANPGALLMWPREEELPEGMAARRPRRNARFEPYRGEPTVSVQSLQAEDQLATDLIVALVTKGFLHGASTI